MAEHYFDASPRSSGEGRDVRVSAWGQDLTLRTAPGVFSADHLDHATAILLRESDPPHGWGNHPARSAAECLGEGAGPGGTSRELCERGRAAKSADAALTLLDLGCGWGPIACLLAAAAPGAQVWATDVNERARELTARNAERLGLDVSVAAPDDVPADLAFDQIWSNPPIRIGKAALHDLLLTWLPRLTDDGEARLVVGKNLGADSLQRWLTGEGWPTERLASAKGFRVLRTRRTP